MKVIEDDYFFLLFAGFFIYQALCLVFCDFAMVFLCMICIYFFFLYASLRISRPSIFFSVMNGVAF